MKKGYGMLEAMKGKVLRKKTLYTICFILLGLIDFVRHTQQEELWGPFFLYIFEDFWCINGYCCSVAGSAYIWYI